MPDCMRPCAGLLFRQSVPASGFQRPRAFFLILAGYFMGRNNSWNKAFKRGYTLLIPFLFWNVAISFLHPGIMNMGLPEYLCNLAGFRSLFTPDFIPLSINGLTENPFPRPHGFEGYHSLFPLSPILLKLRYPVFVLILICFSTDWLQYPVPAQQDYPCSIHRLPVQSGPFPVFHQTG